MEESDADKKTEEEGVEEREKSCKGDDNYLVLTHKSPKNSLPDPGTDLLLHLTGPNRNKSP